MDIGECTSFQDNYVEHASDFYLVWAYMAAVWIGAMLLATAVVLVLRWHERDVALRVALAKHAERYCAALLCAVGCQRRAVCL